MSEFYSLINNQNATFLGLEPSSLNFSAIPNRGVIKISKTTSIILHLIIFVTLMWTWLKWCELRNDVLDKIDFSDFSLFVCPKVMGCLRKYGKIQGCFIGIAEPWIKRALACNMPLK